MTVKDVAERYDVTPATVLAWIKSGDLQAVNVGRRANAGKPRWRITAAALEAFEAARTAAAAPVATRRIKDRRRTNVIEFYK